jgi:hypothetical protein
MACFWIALTAAALAAAFGVTIAAVVFAGKEEDRLRR